MKPLPPTGLTLRFKAYEKHIASRTAMPVGQQGLPVEVLQLNPLWQLGQDASSNCKRILFPAMEKGRPAEVDYFRPQNLTGIRAKRGDLLGIPIGELFLRASGAFVLSQLAGLTVVPSTHLVDLASPGEPASLGSIQRGIKGGNLLKYTLAEVDEAVGKNPDCLIEMYLFTVIAGDVDRRDMNVVLEEETRRLFAIDTEASGASDLKGLEFPMTLSGFLSGKAIPERYLEGISLSVKRQKAYTPMLLPFYPPEAVDEMFRRARILLETGRLLPVEEILKKIG